MRPSLFAFILVAALASAQTQTTPPPAANPPAVLTSPNQSTPQQPAPAQNPQPVQSAPKEETPEQLKVRIERMEKRLTDWPQFARYMDDNSKLSPPARGEKRAVFYGDSITDGWKLNESFPGEGYINRGISGQTTAQMLVRFRADVINLQPRAVVMLAGTNDIAGNTGPTSLQQIEDNYATIAELARIHKIKLILCSVTPVHNYTERAKQRLVGRPPEKILELNRWLKDNAGRYHYTYVDYFSAMIDEHGLLRADFANDGLHPNADGYAVMARIVGPVVAKVVGRKKR